MPQCPRVGNSIHVKLLLTKAFPHHTQATAQTPSAHLSPLEGAIGSTIGVRTDSAIAILAPSTMSASTPKDWLMIAPSRPINAGGPGAIEINARYDYLDLNDAGIIGGRQRTLGVSLVWAPISYVRITANYGRLMFDDAVIAAANGDRDYSADAFGLRTQLDF